MRDLRYIMACAKAADGSSSPLFCMSVVSTSAALGDGIPRVFEVTDGAFDEFGRYGHFGDFASFDRDISFTTVWPTNAGYKDIPHSAKISKAILGEDIYAYFCDRDADLMKDSRVKYYFKDKKIEDAPYLLFQDTVELFPFIDEVEPHEEYHYVFSLYRNYSLMWRIESSSLFSQEDAFMTLEHNLFECTAKDNAYTRNQRWIPRLTDLAALPSELVHVEKFGAVRAHRVFRDCYI